MAHHLALIILFKSLDRRTLTRMDVRQLWKTRYIFTSCPLLGYKDHNHTIPPSWTVPCHLIVNPRYVYCLSKHDSYKSSLWQPVALYSPPGPPCSMSLLLLFFAVLPFFYHSCLSCGAGKSSLFLVEKKRFRLCRRVPIRPEPDLHLQC